ncbi:hypothetical protein [Rouxiella badensis]|uniref:hypothetical protein n=1 Tax=Rouxiella badensis TaxID=1646377 RepID=UPI001788234A|nr:hypothetical protein [Rouxiella badensis]QOI56236.1 hypothetical protein H2866_03545 [Rouxiella badensis subsp. acadiensis]
MAIEPRKLFSSYEYLEPTSGTEFALETVDGKQFKVANVMARALNKGTTKEVQAVLEIGQRMVEVATETALGSVVQVVNIDDLELNQQDDGSVSAEQASRNQAEAIKRNNVALNALLKEWHILVNYLLNNRQLVRAPVSTNTTANDNAS